MIRLDYKINKIASRSINRTKGGSGLRPSTARSAYTPLKRPTPSYPVSGAVKAGARGLCLSFHPGYLTHSRSIELFYDVISSSFSSSSAPRRDLLHTEINKEEYPGIEPGSMGW